MAARTEERSRAAEAGDRPHRRIAGVWCPVLTPVDQDLNPDAARFGEHARWLLDQGCHGLVVFGTTGEANSFSVDERIALLDAILEAGLPRDRLVVGTGCCAVTDTVRLTRHTLSLGITGVLALPPFYYKNNTDVSLFNSFDEVIHGLAIQISVFTCTTSRACPVCRSRPACSSASRPHTPARSPA